MMQQITKDMASRINRMHLDGKVWVLAGGSYPEKPFAVRIIAARKRKGNWEFETINGDWIALEEDMVVHC